MGNEETLGNSIDSVTQFFSNIVGFDARSLAGLAKPEIDVIARSVAEELDERLPHKHWLRSTAAHRTIAVLRSRLRTTCRNQTGAAAAFSASVIYFLFSFYGSFYQIQRTRKS